MATAPLPPNLRLTIPSTPSTTYIYMVHSHHTSPLTRDTTILEAILSTSMAASNCTDEIYLLHPSRLGDRNAMSDNDAQASYTNEEQFFEACNRVGKAFLFAWDPATRCKKLSTFIKGKGELKVWMTRHEVLDAWPTGTLEQRRAVGRSGSRA